MKAWRWIALAAGAMAVIVVTVVAYAVLTFDPRDSVPWLVELVKRETGRTLTVAGAIGLTVFPKIGISMGAVTLSEPDRPTVVARVAEVRVAVALLPLLSRQVIVDHVTLKGLSADLVRGKDGRMNVDDLTGRVARPAGAGKAPGRESPGPPLVIEVGGIEVQDATIGWRDESNGTNVQLSGVGLTTGRLASGVPGKLALAAHVRSAQRAADLRFEVSALYRLDFASGVVALSAVDAKAAGQANGLAGLEARITGEAVDVDLRAGHVTLSRLELAAKTKDGLDVRVVMPRLGLGSGRAESHAMAADIALATPPRRLTAKLRTAPLAVTGGRVDLSRLDVEFTATRPGLSVQGTLATPLRVDLDARRAELPALAGELRLTGEGISGQMRATVRGSSRADWGAQSASADLAGAVDGSRLDVTVAVAHWDRPAITFNVVADRLDLNRYFPPAEAPPGAGGGPVGSGAPARGGPLAEQPFDLSALRMLAATGTVKVGAFQVGNVNAARVAFTVKAAGGVVDIDPISGALYEGTLAGRAVVNAKDNTFAARQRLSGVSVGPLLRALADKDLIEGRAVIDFDVTSAGRTMTALERALAGAASVTIKDGTIKGVDVPAIIGAAHALLGSRPRLERQAQAGARTDFSELSASFLIKAGVAHSEDLQVTSPLLRITARGDVDIAAGTLDYAARATLTAAATAGLGG